MNTLKFIAGIVCGAFFMHCVLVPIFTFLILPIRILRFNQPWKEYETYVFWNIAKTIEKYVSRYFDFKGL